MWIFSRHKTELGTYESLQFEFIKSLLIKIKFNKNKYQNDVMLTYLFAYNKASHFSLSQSFWVSTTKYSEVKFLI